MKESRTYHKTERREKKLKLQRELQNNVNDSLGNDRKHSFK